MDRTLKNLYSIWSQYRKAPIAVRARIAIRFLTCPFAAFRRAVPLNGHLLDVGCGDGQLLYWLLLEPGSKRTALGIEIDLDKIRHARGAAISSADFHMHAIQECPDRHFDAVCIAHVLYLIPTHLWGELFSQCRRVLKVGGVLAVMEVVDNGSWKSWLAHLQELVSVYVTRMTKGEVVRSWPEETYRAALAGVFPGEVVAERADQGYLHPHVLFSACKAK